MLAIWNSLNAHNFPICQPILIILVSKCMIHRALSDKTYLSLGLLSPLRRSGERCMTFGSSTFGMFILMISNPHVHNPVIMGIKFCRARGISL